MILKDKDQVLIQKRLEGRLNTEEILLFKERLESPDFKEEYEFQQSLYAVTLEQKRDSLLASLQEEFLPKAEKEEVEQPKKRFLSLDNFWPKRWYVPAMAATVLLLIGLGITRWSSETDPITPVTLYEEYFKVLPTKYIIVVEANAAATEKNNYLIKTNYDNAQYEQAIEYILDNPSNQESDGIQLLLASAYLKTNETDKAINVLQTIIAENDTPNYTEQAKWYLALAYLKNEKKDAAKTLLIEISKQANSYQNDSAKQILQQLE